MEQPRLAALQMASDVHGLTPLAAAAAAQAKLLRPLFTQRGDEPAPPAGGQREAVLEQARRYHEVVAIFNSSQPQALYNHNASRAALNGFAFCVASGSPALHALPKGASAAAAALSGGIGAGDDGGSSDSGRGSGNGVRRPRGGRGSGPSRSRDSSPAGSRASRERGASPLGRRSTGNGSRDPSPSPLPLGRRSGSRDPSPSGRSERARTTSPGMRGPIERRLPGSSVERPIERHLPAPSVERKLPGFNKARVEEQLQRKAGYGGHAEADVTTCLLLYKLINHYMEKVTVHRGQRQLILDSQADRLVAVVRGPWSVVRGPWPFVRTSV